MLVGRVLRLPEAAAEARDGRGHRGARERQPVIIWFLSRRARFGTSAGNSMRLVRGARPSNEVRLPPGYDLDLSDPDVLILRCPHGTAVARFSARGAAAEAIEQEARMHYRERNRSA